MAKESKELKELRLRKQLAALRKEAIKIIDSDLDVQFKPVEYEIDNKVYVFSTVGFRHGKTTLETNCNTPYCLEEVDTKLLCEIADSITKTKRLILIEELKEQKKRKTDKENEDYDGDHDGSY